MAGTGSLSRRYLFFGGKIEFPQCGHCIIERHHNIIDIKQWTVSVCKWHLPDVLNWNLLSTFPSGFKPFKTGILIRDSSTMQNAEVQRLSQAAVCTQAHKHTHTYTYTHTCRDRQTQAETHTHTKTDMNMEPDLCMQHIKRSIQYRYLYDTI